MDHSIKAQKRPIVVECIQFTGDNIEAICSFVGKENLDAIKLLPGERASFWVEKSDQWIALQPGMWVMAEQDGTGFYPCAEDVFTTTYDRIEE
jgi:hypothetical protein